MGALFLLNYALIDMMKVFKKNNGNHHCLTFALSTHHRLGSLNSFFKFYGEIGNLNGAHSFSRDFTTLMTTVGTSHK